MPFTGIEIISSADLGAGTHVFPARQITVPAGRRGLFLRVERNSDISARWFRPGTVTWEAVLGSGVTLGISTDELLFDEETSFLPPSSGWGGQFRATLRLREFMPLVVVAYGAIRDD